MRVAPTVRYPLTEYTLKTPAMLRPLALLCAATAGSLLLAGCGDSTLEYSSYDSGLSAAEKFGGPGGGLPGDGGGPGGGLPGDGGGPGGGLPGDGGGPGGGPGGPGGPGGGPGGPGGGLPGDGGGPGGGLPGGDTGDTGGFTFTSADVQSILDDNCSGCHIGGGSSGGLTLDDVNDSVNDPSDDIPSMDRIEPGDADNSYIWLKLNNTHTAAGGSGGDMPPSGALASDDLSVIETWIEEGAPE